MGVSGVDWASEDLNIAWVTTAEIEGERGVAGGAALGGAGAFDGNLTFLCLFQPAFFGSLKKCLDPSGPGSSDVSTSSM